LNHIGAWDWFDAVVGSDAVKNHKPAPDVFLEAARQIGIDPAKCCAFEDSDMGIKSARAAGMDVVDVRKLV
ncbi:MAG: HAD family hydrolase, partial [Calditrichaeota bacterium]